MLQKVTDRITFFLLQNQMLNEGEQEWCSYLLQKKIMTWISMAILFLVGSIIANPICTFVFLENLVFLRTRANGYHAKTPRKCLMFGIFVVLVAFMFIRVMRPNLFFNIAMIVAGVIIMWYVYPAMDKKTTAIIRENKEKLRRRVIVELIMASVLIAFSNEKIVILMSYFSMSIVVTAGTILMTKRKEECL